MQDNFEIAEEVAEDFAAGIDAEGIDALEDAQVEEFLSILEDAGY